jgi:hypothetical protein
MRMCDELCAFASVPPPDPDSSLEIDLPPLRVFRWTRPRVTKNYFPLARRVLADVVQYIDQSVFAHVFSALLLEKTIVVYHPSEEVISNVILALHFTLRPLRWASASISVLPEKLEDLLSAPSPMLIGRSRELKEMQPWFVYLDLADQGLSMDGDFPLLPEHREMQKALKPLWQRRVGDLIEILHWTSKIVTKYIEPITSAIESHVNENGRVQSMFCREMYIERFARKEKDFANAFAGTQMFQMQVEQDCRRRSDSLAEIRSSKSEGFNMSPLAL